MDLLEYIIHLYINRYISLILPLDLPWVSLRKYHIFSAQMTYFRQVRHLAGWRSAYWTASCELHGTHGTRWIVSPCPYHLPSGNRLHHCGWENSLFLWSIFNSYQRVILGILTWWRGMFRGPTGYTMSSQSCHAGLESPCQLRELVMRRLGRAAGDRIERYS